MLSQNYKVLAVDMDSQGNLTELLTNQDIYDFHGKTVFEALQKGDPRGYVHKLSDNLHLLTADDLLATFSRYLYVSYKGNRHLFVLKDTLDKIKEEYDFIIIDTPPALGDQTLNALAASDYVVTLFEASKFCYSALERFFETIIHVQEKANPGLQVAGILRTLMDKRRSDAKALIELVEEEYEDLVFQTIINRRASTGRLSIEGFEDNDELGAALEEYEPFIKELLNRVNAR